MRRFTVIALIAVACAGGSGDEPADPTSAGAEGQPTTSDAAAAGTTTTGATGWDVSKPFVGFSISPRAFDEEGLGDFFATAGSLGSLVAWVGPWQDIDQGGRLVTGLVGEHGYVPVIVTGFPTEDGARVLPESEQAMIDAITGFLADHPVPYLGVGVETNYYLWERNPEDLERFAAMFADVVEAVHEVSPDTKVFPGFQLERLRGLKGGLFGDEPTEAEWELVDMFPTADAIGFTTYPGLVFTHPDEIPDDYYTGILEHVDKPIVFTEVGWQARGDLGDWSGTPESQAAYVADWLPELADVADMVIWSFLWDQEAAPHAFASMGLIDADGVERPALDVWREHFG